MLGQVRFVRLIWPSVRPNCDRGFRVHQICSRGLQPAFVRARCPVGRTGTGWSPRLHAQTRNRRVTDRRCSSRYVSKHATCQRFKRWSIKARSAPS